MSEYSFAKVKILIQDEDILLGGKPRSKMQQKNVHFALFNQSCVFVFQWYVCSFSLVFISASVCFTFLSLALVAIFFLEGLQVPEGSSLLDKNVPTVLTWRNKWEMAKRRILQINSFHFRKYYFWFYGNNRPLIFLVQCAKKL